MSTNKLSAKDIKREWHLIDAKGQILGRLSTEAAKLLMGKNKPNYVPYLDCGDNVVIINASEVRVTGKKETRKKYVRHSGYPGGLTVETLEKMRAKKPEKIIIHAISGMLPKNKLGRVMIKKMHVYAGGEHPFTKELKGEKDGKK
ncbi:50S ribosomal protein L13 [Candidatus Daviesbacteria bacterium RIFOXYD1_FULL_41_10]|uniref:Large ribosomal subunit protein uL13 n=1 Tax=Candidatus Daviesbacteria bacterium RIFOXYD1_FULL_41_10 TaxID=1797801 RepID=A0A1F5N0T5_9BACT|nr:MAG: 50S ribosomal protein L13 [Candidatus Daviesbacteria bacterium RIFOXYD1_FULL_41_10]